MASAGGRLSWPQGGSCVELYQVPEPHQLSSHQAEFQIPPAGSPSDMYDHRSSPLALCDHLFPDGHSGLPHRYTLASPTGRGGVMYPGLKSPAAGVA